MLEAVVLPVVIGVTIVVVSHLIVRHIDKKEQHKDDDDSESEQ